MLDARDAMLAADRMRYAGADQAAMWGAFAKRGMGSNASTPTADSGDTRPGFVSPLSTPGKATFTSPAKGKVYIGSFEARATPVADTDPASALAQRRLAGSRHLPRAVRRPRRRRRPVHA